MSLSVFEKLQLGDPVSDEEFDLLFPEPQRIHSDRHYTSVFIARKALEYLCDDPGVTIVDLGSGTGKFCMVGAALYPNRFVGIEYRNAFVSVASELAARFSLNNAHFICEDIMKTDLSQYNRFFMFNPFLEHKDPTAKMDRSATDHNYIDLRDHVRRVFEGSPIGTRIATYYVEKEQIPPNYDQDATYFGGILCFYVKVR